MLAVPESISDGGRIALLPVTPEQTQALYEAIVDSRNDLAPWMEWLHPDYSISDTEQWVAHCRKAWEEDTMFAFNIVENRTHQMLGGCSVAITSKPYRNGAIGYWVRSSRTKQGFATEAAGLLAQFGFAHLGLIRLEIITAADNLASQRVAEKAGALKEGLLRNRLCLRGQPRDAYVYSLIPG
jgi:ribosomal-protein-serine acetyltransferase